MGDRILLIADAGLGLCGYSLWWSLRTRKFGWGITFYRLHHPRLYWFSVAFNCVGFIAGVAWLTLVTMRTILHISN